MRKSHRPGSRAKYLAYSLGIALPHNSEQNGDDRKRIMIFGPKDDGNYVVI
jgi:hypothetical protein